MIALYRLSLINITSSFQCSLLIYIYIIIIYFLNICITCSLRIFDILTDSWLIKHQQIKRYFRKCQSSKQDLCFAEENLDELGNLQCMRSIFPSTATYPKFSYPPRKLPSYRFYVCLGNFAVRQGVSICYPQAKIV